MLAVVALLVVVGENESLVLWFLLAYEAASAFWKGVLWLFHALMAEALVVALVAPCLILPAWSYLLARSSSKDG